MKQKKYTYTVVTRSAGIHYVQADGTPEIFRDTATNYRVLQFDETAWFRLADVVCFFRSPE